MGVALALEYWALMRRESGGDAEGHAARVSD
jgi:hypothetical protein